MAQPVRFKAVVDEVQRYGSDVASYRLHAEKRLPRFSPGQFIHLTLDDYDPAGFWPESRVFSVANAVTDRRTVDLTISRQGHYTSRILNELEPGAMVWAKGPYGDFTVDGDHGYRRAALIAGGTGITPFCAFMDAALKKGALPVDEAILFYGAQSLDLLIYRHLAERCAAKVPGFRAIFYAERMQGSEDPSVIPGRLSLPPLMCELGDVRGTAFFLSGPKAMIETFQLSLTREYQLPQKQVLIDAWE